MSHTILLDESPFGIRGLSLDADDRPVRLLHRFKTRQTPAFGDVFWARAGDRDNRLGMQAFDLGSAGEGFLPIKERQHPKGMLVLVGIRREAIVEKRPVLTDRPALSLPLAVLRPGSPEPKPGALGLEYPSGEVITALNTQPSGPGQVDQVPQAATLIAQLASRETESVVTSSGTLAGQIAPFLPQGFPIYTDDRLHQLFDETTDEALIRHVPIEGGGALIIDETEALTAVDVDLGTTSSQSQKGGGESVRRRALDVLGRVLALRAIGGQVVLDLPRSAVRAPKVLRDQLTAALKPLGSLSIPAVTKEGLAVLVLGQNRRPLLEDLTEPAGDGLLPGRSLAADIVAWRAWGLALSTLSGASCRQAKLLIPGRAVPIFEKAGASQLLKEQTSTDIQVSASNGETIHCEEI